MNLKDFWPLDDKEHAGRCLFTDAETAPDAVFLAVHQQMGFLKKRYKSDEPAAKIKESQLLEDFLEENPDSGRVIMPIVGDSAVGKSHMIRWINARLAQEGLDQNNHVVRIPKSSSMKQFLELIVERLKGDRYAETKKKIATTVVRNDSKQARLDLRSKLTGAVELLRDELQTKQRTEEGLNAEESSRLSHAIGLFHFLNDPAIANNFLDRPQESSGRQGALTRIVAPLIGESHDVNREPNNRFYVDDLAFVRDVAIADLAKATRPYCARLANREETRPEAVDLLNSLLDQALRGLIDFSGTTLPTLFDEIRSALLAEGKELILLIEDFANLGGIQKDLLDAVTNAAEDSKGQPLCVIRTAIAVTEGRLDEDTVLSRAGFAWKIETHPFEDEEKAVTYFTNMVGAYLNAARYGETELDSQLLTTSDKKVANFWETHGEELTEGDRATLEAFGFSESPKYPLFPFNKDAIRQIMDLTLKEDGQYSFRPRLLNKEIRKTIMHYRRDWLEKEFPSEPYQEFKRGKKLGNDVNLRLNEEPESIAPRVGVLLGFWGNCPDTLAEAAALDDKVYKAFHLSPVDWGVKPTTSKKKKITQKKTANTSQPKPVDKSRWRECLKGWKEESNITQRDASDLRTWIAEAIVAWIDPDPLLSKKLSYGDLHGGVTLQKSVFIPCATTGNPAVDKVQLVTCSAEDLSDPAKGPVFFQTMEAVINFHEGKNWNYQDGHKEQIRYLVFIERLAKDWIAHLETQRSRDTSEAIVPLAQSLLIGARILNLENSTSSNADDLMAALLDPGPDQPFPISQQDKWASLKQQTQQARDELRDKLLGYISARQGGADTLHAVDAATLLPALDALQKQDWQLPDDTPNKWADTQKCKQFVRAITKQYPAIIEEKKTEISNWSTTVDENFGVDFDCDTLLEELQNTITLAVDAGCFRFQQNRDHRPLTQQIEGLRQRGDDLRETYTKSKEISPEDSPFGAKLSIVSQIDYELMAETESLIDSLNQFLRQTSDDLDAKLKGAPKPKAKSKQLQISLEALQDHWQNVSTHIVS